MLLRACIVLQMLSIDVNSSHAFNFFFSVFPTLWPVAFFQLWCPKIGQQNLGWCACGAITLQTIMSQMENKKSCCQMGEIQKVIVEGCAQLWCNPAKRKYIDVKMFAKRGLCV